jgi:MobA/MobL family
MASYHCTVKIGGKGKAASHSSYISRDGKYSGQKRYEDLEATAYGNMPKWAEQNPAFFWNAADEYERVNGATYREIEVALPRELNPIQRQELVEAFIAEEIGQRHAYQWAIHTPNAALEKGQQPHAHIMYSERTRDEFDRDPEQYFKRHNAKMPQKGGCRKDSAGTEERLQITRQRWANLQNLHLERNGHTARVDHRSLKKQGIDRQPEKHIGASRVKDMQVQDVEALLIRRAAENELEEAKKQIEPIDLSGELIAAKQQDVVREYARQVTAQFKAEQAARNFAKNTTEKFKAEMLAKTQAEQLNQHKKEVEHQQEQDKKLRHQDGQRRSR